VAPIRIFIAPNGCSTVHTARAHGVRIFVEPFLHGFDNLLVFPARNATLFARRALGLDWAGLARIGPISPMHLTQVTPERTRTIGKGFVSSSHL
jgi:hypothetical protein